MEQTSNGWIGIVFGGYSRGVRRTRNILDTATPASRHGRCTSASGYGRGVLRGTVS